MTDFFISYATANERWATWVAYVLEEERYTTFLQAWDFRPGSNFVLDMQEGVAKSERTIAILSPAYLSSRFGSSEWAAAFADDPLGAGGKLIPVMVERCSPPGLLKTIVHVDMVGADESKARRVLIDGVRPGRGKPASRPSFPGATGAKPSFPGHDPRNPSRTVMYMPKVGKAPTDVERRRFLKDAFEAIAATFEQSLAELAGSKQSIDVDFDRNASSEFTAEIFLNGKATCRCRVWQGGLFSGDAISYAEGSTSVMGNATNEMLSVPQGDDLVLAAMMGVGFYRSAGGFDTKRMSAAEACDYLWRRFVSPLER